MHDKDFRDLPLGTTWRQVDNALRLGLRGLPGGSSLAQLLAEQRGYRNIKGLAPLSEELILRWADAHVNRTGKWPTENSGAVREAPGEDWGNINAALREGHRELPGSDTLGRLLARGRRVRTKSVVPMLTTRRILQLADAFHQRHGKWPKRKSGPVSEIPGETWAKIDTALMNGIRGLRGGSSLARLLARRRGVRHPEEPPRLTRRKILAWADTHREQTETWPTASSGPVVGADGENWQAINLSLCMGQRGLPGGDSLYALLRRERNIGGPRSPLEMPPKPTEGQLRRQVYKLRGRGMTYAGIAHRLGLSEREVLRIDCNSR